MNYVWDFAILGKYSHKQGLAAICGNPVVVGWVHEILLRWTGKA